MGWAVTLPSWDRVVVNRQRPVFNPNLFTPTGMLTLFSTTRFNSEHGVTEKDPCEGESSPAKVRAGTDPWIRETFAAQSWLFLG